MDVIGAYLDNFKNVMQKVADTQTENLRLGAQKLARLPLAATTYLRSAARTRVCWRWSCTTARAAWR